MKSLWDSDAWQFAELSFLNVRPFDIEAILYCDPPYKGTQEYSTKTFNHDLFWNLCRQWSLFVPVYVSEFYCPISAVELLHIERGETVARKDKAKRVYDRLFRICP